MRTPLLVAATSVIALSFGTAALAQGTSTPTTPRNPAATQQMPSQVDAQKLIGRNIQNPQNETIGEIDSVMLGADGKAETVVVGVGGFLGVGKKDVALKWSDLNVMDNGEKVTVAMSKEQLKALPEFTYRDDKQRGNVVPYTVGRANDPAAPPATTPGRTAADTPATAPRAGAAAPPARTAADTPPATAPRASTASRTAAAGPVGTIGTASLVGVNVKNSAGDTIGEIKDVVVDSSGKASSFILGTGGVLGLGERTVPIGWDQISVSRDDGGKVIATSALTKEQIEAMPEYTKDNGAWRPK